jgi:hypothetical protein
MNSLQQRLAAFTETAANLKAQYCELNELREQVRKKLLSARKAPQPKHRNGHDAISRSSSAQTSASNPMKWPSRPTT